MALKCFFKVYICSLAFNERPLRCNYLLLITMSCWRASKPLLLCYFGMSLVAPTQKCLPWASVDCCEANLSFKTISCHNILCATVPNRRHNRIFSFTQLLQSVFRSDFSSDGPSMFAAGG